MCFSAKKKGDTYRSRQLTFPSNGVSWRVFLLGATTRWETWTGETAGGVTKLDDHSKQKISVLGTLSLSQKISVLRDFQFERKIPCAGDLEFGRKLPVVGTLSLSKKILYYEKIAHIGGKC